MALSIARYRESEGLCILSHAKPVNPEPTVWFICSIPGSRLVCAPIVEEAGFRVKVEFLFERLELNMPYSHILRYYENKEPVGLEWRRQMACHVIRGTLKVIPAQQA